MLIVDSGVSVIFFFILGRRRLFVECFGEWMFQHKMDLHLWMRKEGDWVRNYVCAHCSIRWKIGFIEMRNIHIWYIRMKKGTKLQPLRPIYFIIVRCILCVVCCVVLCFVLPSPRRYLKYKCIPAIKMKTPTKQQFRSIILSIALTKVNSGKFLIFYATPFGRYHISNIFGCEREKFCVFCVCIESFQNGP